MSTGWWFFLGFATLTFASSLLTRRGRGYWSRKPFPAVSLGMSEEQIIATWGKPTNRMIVTDRGGDMKEVYTYERYRDREANIHFRDGKVSAFDVKEES